MTLPDSDVTDDPAVRRGIFSSRYLWVTIGSCALVFLSAFESLAVTTIMPLVSDDLDGKSLYALAFAGPLATGVIGMVLGGNWSDRRGPRAPLIWSAVLFVAGLLLSGLAVDMRMFLLGRLVQGLGGGAVTVALYVVVARIYPPALHPRIFAGFAAAWVVPSLIGPYAAGVVAEVASWHWVFLGVVGLVLIAVVMMIPALRMLRHEVDAAVTVPPWQFARIGWAVVAASAVLALNLSSQLQGVMVGVTALAAIAIAVVAVRHLVPRGVLRARRGLPSVILVRGLATAGFFGTEVYIPYLLIAHYDFSPAFAGLALTAAALTWAGASWLQGHLGERLSHASALRWGSALVLAAVSTALVTAVATLPAVVVIVGWLFGGAGMGLMYPRMSVMTLAYSTPDNQGFNSSAMSISDSLGGALALASTAIVFAAFAGAVGAVAFAGCFALTTVIAIVTVFVAPRVELVGAQDANCESFRA